MELLSLDGAIQYGYWVGCCAEVYEYDTVGLDDIALPVTRMHNTWCVSPVMSCPPAPAAFGHDLLFRAFYPNRRSYSPLHCQTDLFQRPHSSCRRAIPPLPIWGAFVTTTDATEEVGTEARPRGVRTMQTGEMSIFRNFGSERSEESDGAASDVRAIGRARAGGTGTRTHDIRVAP